MSRSEDRRLEAQLAGADIKLVLDERRRLQAEVSLLRDQLHLAEENHVRRVAELEEAAKERQNLERTIQQVRAEKSLLRDRLTESENKRWAVACEAVDAKERIAELQAEVASLRETLRVAAEEPVEGPDPPVGQEAMETLVASLSRRRSTLWAFQLQEQNSQLRAEVAELKEQRKRLEDDRTGLRGTVARQRKREEALQAEVEALRKELYGFPVPGPEPTEPPECPICGEGMTGHTCPGCGWEEAGNG